MLDKYDFVKYVHRFIDRNLHRSIKYSVSGFLGFLFVELFTFLLFHYMGFPYLVAVPPSFLAGVAIE